MGRELCRLGTLLVALGMVPACGGSGVAPAASGLDVEAPTFSDGWVGYPQTAQARLRDLGRVPLQVELSTSSPFSATPTSLELAPGGSAEVVVTFQPATSGLATGELVAHAGDQTQQVPLSAAALAPETCTPARPCWMAQFDPGRGHCAQSAEPDGTPCATPCLSNATCLAGACVGATRNCDDGDPCTADACGASGCVHAQVSCPALSDPCQVARCEPGVGCTSKPASDGTSCGPGDCTSSRVCMAGACVAVPTPEGGPCGVESPCQPYGRCQAGACVQEPPHPLQPAWQLEGVDLTPPSEHAPVDLVADDDGNLYLAILGPGGEHRLRSLTPSGLTRFDLPTPERWTPLATASGRLLVQSPTALLALAAEDGSVLWQRPQGLNQYLDLVATGDLLLVNQLRSQGDFISDALNARDGHLLWTAPVSDWAILADSRGDFLVGGATDLPAQLALRDTSGAEVWQADAGTWPWAIADDQFVTQGGEVFRTLDGAPLGQLVSSYATASRDYRLTGGLAWVFDLFLSAYSLQRATVEVWELDPPALRHTWSVPEWLREPGMPPLGPALMNVTARGTLLFGAVHLSDPVLLPTSPVRLHEVSPDGADLWACDLTGPLASMSSLLSHGYWLQFTPGVQPGTAALEAYPLSGLELAPQGWVTAQGNPGRTHAPR